MNFKFQGFTEQSVFMLTDFSEGNFTASLNKDNYKIAVLLIEMLNRFAIKFEMLDTLEIA